MALDALGLAIGLFNLQFPIPPEVFWLLALTSVVWAGYRVYVRVLPPNMTQSEPKIALGFMEGNEYVYSLQGKDNANVLLPESSVVVHLRIQNEGPNRTRILLIEGSYLLSHIQESLKPSGISDLGGALAMSSGKVLGKDKASYPINLEPNEILTCDIYSEIEFGTHFTPAQFAARLAEIPLKARNPKIRIQVEVQNVSDGRILKFEVDKEISLRPLKDLYITYWQQIAKQDLLDIANVAQPVVVEDATTAATNQI